ncbi:MAG TPA: metallophosphoesterase [Candidatus Sulfotelmatobacter sp.]|nr:metallophosphoesterase [Candidatus Sulfotelmatobacter sp.]
MFALLMLAPWLFVSDVHLDPRALGTQPVTAKKDTNAALLRSALDEMRRVDPDPPVVVIAGDFLAHDIRREDAVKTEALVANAFDEAFPHAQFLVTLGNEDSDCGDYRIGPGATFLRAFAGVWEPLVNRGGAAPGFQETFSREGFYTARLPLRGVRAVVADDVAGSLRFRPCGVPDGAADALRDLRAALAPHGERSWVLFHIPPGIDAYSTIRLAHGLVVVPLLTPQWRAGVVTLLDDPARNVGLVIAGHVHRFSFRLLRAGDAAPVPLLTIPAISPIYGNTPSFLTVDVASDGTIDAAQEHSLLDGRWQIVGGTRTLGLARVDGPSLAALQTRLAHDAGLRAIWSRLYDGAAPAEITQRSWRAYWCVATALTASAYRGCLREGGYSVFTTRGILLAAVALLVLAALALGAARLVVRRTRLPRNRVP